MHIMIMIIAIIYIFLSYVIFNEQLKITFRKSSEPLPTHHPSPMKKSTPSTPPLWKFKKCKPSIFANIENFSGPPAERGETLCLC